MEDSGKDDDDILAAVGRAAKTIPSDLDRLQLGTWHTGQQTFTLRTCLSAPHSWNERTMPERDGVNWTVSPSNLNGPGEAQSLGLDTAKVRLPEISSQASSRLGKITTAWDAAPVPSAGPNSEPASKEKRLPLPGVRAADAPPIVASTFCAERTVSASRGRLERNTHAQESTSAAAVYCERSGRSSRLPLCWQHAAECDTGQKEAGEDDLHGACVFP